MSNSLRVSATLLEAWRLYAETDAPFMNDADLRASMSKGYPGSEGLAAMALGTAWHRLMERSEEGVTEGCKTTYNFEGPEDLGPAVKDEAVLMVELPPETGKLPEGWQGPLQTHYFIFAWTDVERSLKLIPNFGTPETKLYRDLALPDGTLVRVVVKVDRMFGVEVAEYKTTANPRARSHDRHAPSAQWRAALWASKAKRMTYYVFHFKLDQGMHKLVDTETFQFYAYPELDQDVRSWAGCLVRYAREHGLESYLDGAQRAEADALRELF